MRTKLHYNNKNNRVKKNFYLNCIILKIDYNLLKLFLIFFFFEKQIAMQVKLMIIVLLLPNLNKILPTMNQTINKLFSFD